MIVCVVCRVYFFLSITIASAALYARRIFQLFIINRTARRQAGRLICVLLSLVIKKTHARTRARETGSSVCARTERRRKERAEEKNERRTNFLE